MLVAPDSVVVSAAALDRIGRATRDWPDTETGGILLGYVRQDRQIVVVEATAAGTGARRTTSSFYLDGAEARRAIRAAFPLELVGAWHSHHRMTLCAPSGGDLATASRVVEEHRLGLLLLAVTNVLSDGFLSVGFFAARPGRATAPACSVKLASGGMPEGVRLRQPGEAGDGPADRRAARLAEEMEALSAEGVPHRVRPSGRNVELEIDLPGWREVVLVLGPDHPETAPVILVRRRRVVPLAWPDRELVARVVTGTRLPVPAPGVLAAAGTLLHRAWVGVAGMVPRGRTSA